MRTRALPAAAALAVPLLLSGCGGGSVEEFCAVHQQVDEAESAEEGLPLLEDLQDVAPSDRLEDSVEAVRVALARVEELEELPRDEQAEVEGAVEFLDAYVDQNCAG
ncbi:hypothetical protein [Geodermatophilus sp. SYSU D00815]